MFQNPSSDHEQDESPIDSKKYRNKKFAKESRERKKRYIKDLEKKVESLEFSVTKVNRFLIQFLN